MAPNGTRRSHAQDQRLAALIAAGARYATAGSEVGVSERTVKRRMTDPQFRQLVVDHQAELAARTAAQLGDLAGHAVETLADLMREGNSDRSRLVAAKAVLDHAPRWRDTIALEGRIAELEHKLNGDLR